MSTPTPFPPARPEIAAALLARAPRVTAGARGVVWADAHGFSLHGKAELAGELVEILERRGVASVRAGVADTPVAAELAAIFGTKPLTIVPPGADRAYVALFPLEALDPEPRLRPLLFGIGVATCGELAALEREAVEVRLGASAVPLWRLARADDPRILFASAPREAPHASLDWVEYALKDPARLLFVLNTLVDRVGATLGAEGRGARELTVTFALTNRQVHVEVVRAARPTTNRRTWMRLVRTRVERLQLLAAVTGITVHASQVAEREAPQGDLFDRGLASREATEDAVVRLVEDQGTVVVAPRNSAHPLLDERTTWAPREPAQAVRFTPLPAAVRERPRLALQLAPTPRPIAVETAPRRDFFVPVRYRDEGAWHEVVHVAGPERVSGRAWDGDAAYAREYFRCVTREGRLVWVYRDAGGRPSARRADGPAWFLHGWWD